MLSCSTIQLASTLLLKSVLPALTRWFIEKQLLGRKLARNPLKTPGSNSKSLICMICYPSHEIFRYQNLRHTFQTLRTVAIEVTPLYFTCARHTTHKNFIDLTYSISLLSHNLQLTNLRTREYYTFPISNLFCTPKLIHRHYKLSKIEKNGIIGILLYFCKIIYLQLISL